jgi:hypothetical protein
MARPVGCGWGCAAWRAAIPFTPEVSTLSGKLSNAGSSVRAAAHRSEARLELPDSQVRSN